MTTAPNHDGLKAAYEDVAYVGRPNHHSHPDRLAAIATLFGLTPSDPATARVLEIGCGDGANLLPMATGLPRAKFVGCDFSSLLMSRARAMANGVGLTNVDLIEGDLREVASTLGTFDYIIAHGFYSWVPADVREVFVALAGTHLAPGGLVFASYNILPGCLVRRVGWDAMKMDTAGIEAPRERLAAARGTLRDLAAAWRAIPGVPAQLAREFADDPEQRSDGALFHDDLSGANDPVYFTTFVRHVGAHGLGYLAEAEPGTMGLVGLPPRMQQTIVSADALAREQYLDFARVRRFRQSVLAKAADVTRARLTPEAIDRLHLSAVTALVQERAAGAARSVEGTLVDIVVDAYPGSLPATEVAAKLEKSGVPHDDARGLILRGCFSGAVELHSRPLAIVTHASERPRAGAIARWQAARDDLIINLRHEGVRVEDETARAMIAASDGTRDRTALAAASGIGAAAGAAGVVDHYLERFALSGLLEA